MNIEEGDIVLCIRNDGWEEKLTVGKEYRVERIHRDDDGSEKIVIRQDTGKYFAHLPIRFKKVR